MRLGHPKKGEGKETVRRIHICLDEKTDKALERLERKIGVERSRGHTPEAVRRAILEAAARLKP